MKKLLAVVCATLLGATCLFGCGQEEPSSYNVYCPDGAPALALASVMAEENEFNVEVVDSSKIATYVTYAPEHPSEADFAVLPLNVASLTLGSGENYKMLGTVTNGNMYFLSTLTGEEITEDNIGNLVGKKIGVVQLANVPGMTLRAVLADHELEYSIMADANDVQADKVNLRAMEATDVVPSAGFDYYLCPEPAATTKIVNTGKFKMAGDLQALYGEGGYPQAVAVVKNGTPKTAIDKFVAYLDGADEYLANTDFAVVNSLLNTHRTEGLKPSFNALNNETVLNCSVGFTASATCKEKVNAFLAKLNAVDSAKARAVADAFYYV